MNFHFWVLSGLSALSVFKCVIEMKLKLTATIKLKLYTVTVHIRWKVCYESPFYIFVVKGHLEIWWILKVA